VIAINLDLKEVESRKRSETPRTVILNLGCGRDIREGCVNIDHEPGPGIDLQLDISQVPMPFADDTVDRVLCSHVLEHILDWEKVVIDVYRMLRPGGMFELRVPYGFAPRAWHRAYFDKRTMDLFTAKDRDEVSSNDAVLDFEVLSLKVSRRLPMRYHLKKYLRLNTPYNFVIGRRWEICWMLRKPDHGKRERMRK
jgi:SAM-dependent methyltransferase